MRLVRRPATLVAAALLWGSGLRAQAPSDSTAQRQQRTLDSLIQVIRDLQAQIDSLAQPRQARLGPNAQNPEISVTGDFRIGATNPRAEGTAGDNFVARKFEMGFQSALDPYAAAKIFASFEGGEVSIEEGYLYFPVLPGHVRLDIGRFRQEIGELNRWHLHAVPEDEYPLVVRRYASDHGLIGTGVSLYWPLPFSGQAGTYELYVQGTTGDNSVLYAGGNRPAVLSKLAGFWQLSRSTYLMASASGTYGTNPDTGLTTSLAVLATRLTWRPPAEGMARELTVRGEYWNLHRSFSGVATTRYGGYADATWKLNRRYTVSTRWDWLQAADPMVASHEWAITPALTYWQSEFVFLRALFEHACFIDPGQPTCTTHDRFTIQAVFAMGPHRHELF